MKESEEPKKHEQYESGAGKTFLHISSRMASFGVYVPEGSDLLKKIHARADAEHDGKVSSYARAAIERDIEGGTAAKDAVLVEMTRLLQPGIADGMAQLCAKLGVNQARILAVLLSELYRNFEDISESGPGIKDIVAGRGLILLKLLPRDATSYEWRSSALTADQFMAAANFLRDQGRKTLTSDEIHAEAKHLAATHAPLSGAIPNSPVNQILEAETQRRAAQAAKSDALPNARKNAATPRRSNPGAKE